MKVAASAFPLSRSLMSSNLNIKVVVTVVSPSLLKVGGEPRDREEKEMCGEAARGQAVL